MPASDASGRAVCDGLKGLRIGRIGDHPPGFDTCAYDAAKLDALAGITVETMPLERLFDTARLVSSAETGKVRALAETTLSGLDAVNQDELDR